MPRKDAKPSKEKRLHVKKFDQMRKAAENGKALELRAALSEIKSSEIDTRDSDGAKSDYTALQLAAQNGHASCVELLLQRGARIDQKDNNGLTPFHWCALNAHGSALKTLLKAASSSTSSVTQSGLVESRDNAGQTALAWAVKKGNRKIVEWLVDKVGANIEVTDRYGTTLQQLAAQNGYAKILWWLLDKRPNLTGLIDTNNNDNEEKTNDNDSKQSTSNDPPAASADTAPAEASEVEPSPAPTSGEEEVKTTKKKKVSARKRALVASVIAEWHLYQHAQTLVSTVCWPVNIVAATKSKKTKKSKDTTPASTAPAPVTEDVNAPLPITKDLNQTLTNTVLEYLRTTSELFFATEEETTTATDE